MSGQQGRGRGGGRGRGQAPSGSQGGYQGGSSGGDRRRGGDRGRGSPARGSSGDRGGRGGSRGGRSFQQIPDRTAGPPIYHAGQPVPPVEERSKAIEDALVLQTSGKMIDGFPGRRGFGTQGRPIVLRTNYFRVTTGYEDDRKPLGTIYRYVIDITPEQTRPRKRRFVEELLKEAMFNGIVWATDYAQILITTQKLEFNGREKWEKKILLPPPAGDTSSQSQRGPAPAFVRQAQDRNTARVGLEFDRTYSLQDLIDWLRSESSGTQYVGGDDFIQLLNIVVTKAPHASATIANVGSNKFYPFSKSSPTLREQKDLGNGLEALRGYFSSMRPAIGRLLLNVNITSGAFFEPDIKLIDLVEKTELSRHDEQEVFLQHLKVRATYIKNNEKKPFMEKTKTIVGYAKSSSKRPPAFTVQRFGNAHQVTFRYSTAGGPQQETTVYDYFSSHHSIRLKRPELPVLNVGTREDPQYLPQELCTVLPGQPYRKLLQSEQTANMITFAARGPKANAESIAGNGLRMLSLAPAVPQQNVQRQSVDLFGFRVSTDMITVPARILPNPVVQYKDGNANIDSASWNLKQVKFREGGTFSSWQAVMIATTDSKGRIVKPLDESGENGALPQPLLENFSRSLRGYGIQLGTQRKSHYERFHSFTRENRDANDKILSNMFKQVTMNGQVKEKGKILLIILPKADRWFYARIKYYADVMYGIHTVNTIGSKFQNPNGQPGFFGNLALKFNVKGGGVSHHVPQTLMGPVGDDTILFGIDVTHPSPGSASKAPSIACVVANRDSRLFQWPGSIRTQKSRQEMVSGLKKMVLERLDLWRENNKQKRYPSKVVIYRDGVSEGQFKLVLERELPGFQAAYQERYGDKSKWPKTAIIIVGKRHHTRFYPTQAEDADRDWKGKSTGNTQPGTVVDRGIVGRVIHEFYLQPHKALQGTVRPSHYSVIKDEIGFNANDLERLTLNLCYYFARCTRAVSICPPAYYADLLAERGRAYLFTKMQEDHADGASTTTGGTEDDSDDDGDDEEPPSGSTGEWRRGVHPDVANVSWYI